MPPTQAPNANRQFCSRAEKGLRAKAPQNGMRCKASLLSYGPTNIANSGKKAQFSAESRVQAFS
jgi:hypothetical protein